MDFGIAGKKALVCAASKGLGRASAVTLAKEGVEVMLCARSVQSLDQVEQEIRQSGGRAHSHACDLTDGASRQSLIDAANKVLGQVDILIHNVGGPKATTVEGTSLDDWRQGYEQLFPGIVHLNSAFLPAMKQRQWGRIVAITSISVLEPIASLAISNAMRAAVTAMLKTLADEVALANVTINCVAPGLIATDRAESLMQNRIERSGLSREDYMKDYLKSIPAGRLGDPAEFGAVVAFLCSQQASYVTGSTIAVDGGKRRSTY